MTPRLGANYFLVRNIFLNLCPLEVFMDFYEFLLNGKMFLLDYPYFMFLHNIQLAINLEIIFEFS